MSTFSPNLQIEEVARNADVGTWDTPTNNNWTLMDSVIGNQAIIGLNNSNVVLSAAQFQSKQLTFISTLTGSVTITFPTSFQKSYEIQNSCTGSSAFTITLATTAAAGGVICAPPGEIVDVCSDGISLRFKNLGRIGEYWDYAGSSVPNWVSGCTVPPYLNCIGGSVSSATYPVLFGLIGATLPDSRGRSRFALNQGTGRTTLVIADVLFNAGGDQLLQSHAHNNVLNDLGHTHPYVEPNGNTTTGGGAFAVGGPQVAATTGSNNSTPMSITNAAAGGGAGQNMPPAYLGGITMIRAA